jgi:WD40 repeat protein
MLFGSGHTSTVWALSFNASGDKMVTCRYVNHISCSRLELFSGIFMKFYAILTSTSYCSDDLTLKVWGTESMGMQSGGGFAPW